MQAFNSFNPQRKLGMAVWICNTNDRRAETGGSPWSCIAISVSPVPIKDPSQQKGGRHPRSNTSGWSLGSRCTCIHVHCLLTCPGPRTLTQPCAQYPLHCSKANHGVSCAAVCIWDRTGLGRLHGVLDRVEYRSIKLLQTFKKAVDRQIHLSKVVGQIYGKVNLKLSFWLFRMTITIWQKIK